MTTSNNERVASLSNQGIVDYVCKMVMSSTRNMPAYFTSGYDGRSKSFCIHFEALDVESETNMANEAYRSLAQFVASNGSISPSEYAVLVKFGEDVMLGSFIAASLNQLELIDEIKGVLISQNLHNFKTNTLKFAELLKLIEKGTFSAYLDHCSKMGSYFQKDSI